MTKLVTHSFILSLNLLVIVNCRQLSFDLNPNCPKDKCADDINLAYIKSKGDTDSVHYLWSSTKCIPPSLLIAKTDSKTTVMLKWESLFKHIQSNCSEEQELRNFVNINGNVSNSIDFQIRRLFFFSDSNKTGSYDPIYHTLDIKWDSSNGFVWDKTITNKNSEDSIKLSFTNKKNENATVNGIVTFDLRIDASDGRTDDLPQLAFTDSSASLQLSVVGVQTNDSDFKNLRLMAMIDVSAEKPVSSPKFDDVTKIDDEYSPGVFKQIILDLKQNKTKGNEEPTNSYVYWKPIAYIADERISANTLDVVQQLVTDNSSAFSKQFWHTFNLTFGSPDETDTYYEDKKYATFSMVVGIGSAPTDELSLLVKLVIVVGFGLPALIIGVSAVYIIVRKVRNRNANNLLLSQSNQSIDNSRQ